MTKAYTEEQYEQQRAMFGCTIPEMIEGFEEHAFGINKVEEIASLIQSILSDAQEELIRGNSETARQYMNQAKYFASEIKKEVR